MLADGDDLRCGSSCGRALELVLGVGDADRPGPRSQVERQLAIGIAVEGEEQEVEGSGREIRWALAGLGLLEELGDVVGRLAVLDL